MGITHIDTAPQREHHQIVRTVAKSKEKFRRIGDATLDERKRISLTKAIGVLKKALGDKLDADVRFGIYVSDTGQVLLSPEVSIPMHEAWLYRNPKALKSVLKGLQESGEGKVVSLGSFAKYANEEIE
jgi:hypothetical protein